MKEIKRKINFMKLLSSDYFFSYAKPERVEPGGWAGSGTGLGSLRHGSKRRATVTGFAAGLLCTAGLGVVAADGKFASTTDGCNRLVFMLSSRCDCCAGVSGCGGAEAGRVAVAGPTGATGRAITVTTPAVTD
jgi:hypothetical protein